MPRFETELVAKGGGVVAEVPDDVMEELGGRRVPVVATVNRYSWRTTTAVYGGVAMIGLNKAVRQTAGVAPRDRVAVELARDDHPREVEVPEALAVAFANDVLARDAFNSLAYTHRREYAEWIAEAKRPETRERRLAKALEMLRDGNDQLSGAPIRRRLPSGSVSCTSRIPYSASATSASKLRATSSTSST